MKKKKLFNLVMVIAIVVIIVAGLMAVGSVKGWFGGGNTIEVVDENGNKQSFSVIIDNKIGSANIERSGVAYALKDGTELCDGDTLQTLNGSSVDVMYGNSVISLGENSEVVVHLTDSFMLELNSGEMFAIAETPITVQVLDSDVITEKGTFYVSAPYGSGLVYVLENSATVGGSSIKTGQSASILSTGVETSELQVVALNDFCKEKIRVANESHTLCFTNEDLDNLEEERMVAMENGDVVQILSGDKTNGENQNNETSSTDKGQQNQNNGASSTDKGQQNQNNGTSSTDKGQQNQTTTDDAVVQAPEDEMYCTITIRCDTILDNMARLTAGKDKYVPANGIILATSQIAFEEGDTAFDVLQDACTLAGIQLEYSWTPMYNSYYIEGINHLYEFDCGEQSGWMYKVNGWFPNYGCSSYDVEEGDAFVWTYTCNGLGADVGAGGF